MVSAGKVATRQTSSGAVAVIGATVTLTRPTARVAVVTTLALVALTTVRIGNTFTLTGRQVAKHVPRAQTVALTHCTHTYIQTRP